MVTVSLIQLWEHLVVCLVNLSLHFLYLKRTLTDNSHLNLQSLRNQARVTNQRKLIKLPMRKLKRRQQMMQKMQSHKVLNQAKLIKLRMMELPLPVLSNPSSQMIQVPNQRSKKRDGSPNKTSKTSFISTFLKNYQLKRCSLPSVTLMASSLLVLAQSQWQ